MVNQNFSNKQEFAEIKVDHLKDLGDYALGLKLFVKCFQSTYVGICHHILHDSREVLLEQVSVVNTGAKQFGLVTIFYHDVITLNVIGVDKKARKRLWKRLYKEVKVSQTSLMKQILPPSLCDVEGGFSASDDPHCETADETATLLPNFRRTLIRPTNWKIVDTFEEHYKVALLDIKQESVVSVFGYGLKLGRRGTLAWLCLEAGSTVYLFDVAKLGADEFIKSEVGAIFTDETKVKVIHNGRKLEDYLHHYYHMNMTNVFDTQASDIYLESFNEEKEVSLLVKSLPTLLQQHLQMAKLSTVELFPEMSEEEESLWLERPLPEALVVFLIHSVIFLRELREIMLKRMLVNLDQINRLFLGSLRDRPTAIIDYVEEQIVPPEIQKIFKQPFVSKSFKINYTQKK